MSKPILSQQAMQSLLEELLSVLTRHIETASRERPATSSRMDTLQAAQYIGVAPATLKGWRHEQRENQAKFVKLSPRMVRYERRDPDKWLNAR